MTRRMSRSLAVAIAGASLVLGAACSGSTPRDVGPGTRRSEFPPEATGRRLPKVPPPEEVAAPPPSARAPSPRALARVISRAIATDRTHVYFGDAEDDALLAVPKAGGEPVTLARRAPVRRALSREDELVAWIPTPGDVVLSMAIQGGLPKTLRERGIFADITTHGGDVYVTEVVSARGILTRITGHTASRLGTFDGQPRGIAADATDVFVATSASMVRAPRKRGDLVILAEGARFDAPATDDEHVYAVRTTSSGDASVIRLAKSGGELETVASGARPEAPFALHAGEIYFVDAARPVLRAARLADGTSRIVGEEAAIARTVAIAADDDGVFFATGDARLVLALPLR
jgi:hypothetical protein